MIPTTVVAAVFLGIAAQVLAERWRLPAILPLLLLGMAAGPRALGILDPDSLGGVLEALIPLGVAVILFEGGLSLELRELRGVGAAVRNLLSLGLVVTGAGAAFLAHAVTGLPWSTAALFGAIVTVTGPTVIVPLLRQMIAPRQVKAILVSEGLLIDPLGAVLAYLVLRWIQRAGIPPQQLASELLTLAVAGVVVGFASGTLGQRIARGRWVSGELLNVVVLALVLACFLVAEKASPESGILAVVVMGMTMSAAEIPDLEGMRNFKEQLTLLLISVLFILLAAQLDLEAVWDLGWRGLVVVLGLVLLVRPLSVFVSVLPGWLDRRGRLVLALTAPRGIVAAAVASLAARELAHAGSTGGAALEGLVYLTILVTGAWATAMAVVLPRALGYLDDPSRRRVVLVGVHALSSALALALHRKGRKVVMVDAVRRKLDEPRRLGVGAVRGDARAAATYERAGVERDTAVVLLTPNDELNVLAAELVHQEFGVERPAVALQTPSPEFGSRRRAWMVLLGGEAVNLPLWEERLHDGQAQVLTLPLGGETTREALEELREHHPEELLLLCGWSDGEPRFAFGEGALEGCDELTVAAAAPALEELSRLPEEVEVEAEGEATPPDAGSSSPGGR